MPDGEVSTGWESLNNRLLNTTIPIFTNTEAEAQGVNHGISRSFDSKRSPQNFPSYPLTKPLLANGQCYSVASDKDRLSWSQVFLAIQLFSILHV